MEGDDVNRTTVYLKSRAKKGESNSYLEDVLPRAVRYIYRCFIHCLLKTKMLLIIFLYFVETIDGPSQNAISRGEQ